MALNFAQTFYLDPNSVNNSTSAILTEVTLFFKSKPDPIKTITGITYPGVNISICDTKNGVPDLTSVYDNSKTRIEYPGINAAPNPSVPTAFILNTPVILATGKTYAILVSYDDPNFQVWTSTTGDRIFGTNNPFQGVTGLQGKYYSYSDGGNWNASNTVELKFNISVAKFTSNNTTISLENKSYEFLKYNNISNTFLIPETVYVNASPVSGNVSITANSSLLYSNGAGDLTTFISVGDAVVVSTNSTTKVVKEVLVVNSTTLTVNSVFSVTNAQAKFFKSVIGKVYKFDSLSNTIFLTGSTANSTVKFGSSNVIVGEVSGAYANVSSVYDLPVHQFLPQISIYMPPAGYANLSYNFALANTGPGYITSSSNETLFDNNVQQNINKFPALILSRSNEVVSQNSMFSNTTNYKSELFKVNIGVNQSNSALYQSPQILEDWLNVFIANNSINNDDTNENTLYGNAFCKHITTTVNFPSGKSAEDIFAYVSAYQPANTTVEVYAKIHNSNDPDLFVDKNWTKLSPVNNSNTQLSSSVSNNDYVELAFSLPIYPPSLYTANGTVTVKSGNNQLVGSGTNFSTELSVGDVIKVYSPLFPQNYFISSVLNVVSTTAINIDTTTANSSVLGAGFKVDKISTPHTAFVNPQNSNISRYYNSSMAIFDSYDSMKFKIVLLAANPNLYPRVAAFRAIGVSA